MRGYGTVKLIPWGVVLLHLLLATCIPVAHSIRHGHDRDFVDLGSRGGEEAQTVIGSVCPFCSAGLGALSPSVPDTAPVAFATVSPPLPDLSETFVSASVQSTNLARAPPLA